MWGLPTVLRRRQGIKCHPFFASVDWDALLKKKVAVPYVPHLAGPSDYTYFDRMIPGVGVVAPSHAVGADRVRQLAAAPA